MSESEQTDFGFTTVTATEKTARVQQVFSNVASRYDVMNDLMSFGLHRCWKRYLLSLCAAHKGDAVLDVAGGTGDIARLLQKRVGADGRVVLLDLNAEMLKQGRTRSENTGMIAGIDYLQADAERLPLASTQFKAVTIAFGLRNVTHKELALAEMARVLKPGGQLLIMEFSKPIHPLLQTIYDQYSFKVIPFLGELVTNDADSYRYLVESIRRHPDQQTLKQMVLAAGFDECYVHNLCGGIVAVHRAYRF